MSKKRPPPEGQRGKTEGSDVPPGETTSPMDKFKSLTRDLLKVSRSQIQDEQQKYESSKTSSSPKREK